MNQHERVRELFADSLGIARSEVTDTLSYNTEKLLKISSAATAFEILRKTDVDC